MLKGEYEKAVSYYLDSVEVTLAPKIKMELSASLKKEGWKAFCEKAYTERAKLSAMPNTVFIHGAPIDTVFAALNERVGKMEGPIIYILVDPSYDPIRSDPRFQELLKKMRLDKYQ